MATAGRKSNADNCQQSLCVGPWLNRVDRAGAQRLLCCTIVPYLIPLLTIESPFPILSQWLEEPIHLTSIHLTEPECKNPFSCILIGPFGKINNWKHNVLRAGDTDLMRHLRTPSRAHVFLTFLPKLPSSSLMGPRLNVCTMQRAWTQSSGKCSQRKDQFFMNESLALWEAGRSRRGGLL